MCFKNLYVVGIVGIRHKSYFLWEIWLNLFPDDVFYLRISISHIFVESHDANIPLLSLTHLFGCKSQQKSFCPPEHFYWIFNSPGIKLPSFALDKYSNNKVPVLGPENRGVVSYLKLYIFAPDGMFELSPSFKANVAHALAVLSFYQKPDNVAYA